MTEIPLSDNPQYQFFQDKIIENTGAADWKKNANFYTKMFKEYKAAADEFKILEIIGNFNAEMEMGKTTGKVIKNPGAYLNKCLQNGLKALKES
jgi:hypothetical protein